MATEKLVYSLGDDPQAACAWIRARGGRAAIVGVTMLESPQSQAIIFDSGFDTVAKLLVQGDSLTYNTASKSLKIGLSL